MPSKYGGRPPLRHAADDLPKDERATKQLKCEFTDSGPPSQDETPWVDEPLISPIACAFGDEILLGAVMDMADWAASHALSAAQGAWRGDKETIATHLEQASNAIKAARMAFDALEAELAKAAP